jgi:hypothetical protein
MHDAMNLLPLSSVKTRYSGPGFGYFSVILKSHGNFKKKNWSWGENARFFGGNDQARYKKKAGGYARLEIE